MPALLIRAVSDLLETPDDGDSAALDFDQFVAEAVDHYVPIVSHIVERLGAGLLDVSL